MLVSIEITSTTDAKKAVEEIEADSMDHIDIVSSNTAVSPTLAQLEVVDAEQTVEVFGTNTVSSVLLYRAIHKLLTKSNAPK